MTATFSVRKVTSNLKINENTIWLTLDGDINGTPGQFVMAWLPGIGEKPFSIASMDPFGLLVVDVGPCSHALHQLKPGDSLWIKGPLGHGFTLEGDNLLLVGGGYGAAPLLSLAKAARNQGKKVVVCLGAHTEQGLLLSDAFRNEGCKVSFATEDGSRGSIGLVTIIVAQAIKDSDFDMLYACGPVGMLSALAVLCRSHHMNYQLSWEAHMRCGMGLCGSCEVPQSYDLSLPVGWLACFDGPVFIHRWVNKSLR
jgi:dihydroorotate dehydrogenase electron transfer subunit